MKSSEVVEYLKTECVNNGVSKAYTIDIISEKLTNVCAVRPIGTGTRTTLLNCDGYITQNFGILYRGTDDRKASLEIIEEVEKSLHNTNDVISGSTRIINIDSSGVQFAFTDNKKYVNFNINLQIIYCSI